jgi:hypothetical protein
MIMVTDKQTPQLKRCPKCQSLKILEDFPRDRRLISGRGSPCKQCRNQQDNIRLGYHRVKRPWTKEEDQVVLGAFPGGLRELPPKLNRTYLAVRQRLNRLRSVTRNHPSLLKANQEQP